MVMRLRIVLCLLVAACAPSHKQLVIPDEMLAVKPERPVVPAAQPSTPNARLASTALAQTTAQPQAAAKAASAQNVVVKLAEHGRNWEIELPDSSGGYELRLPLGDAVPDEKPTAADQELLARADKKTPEAKRSYLSGLARVTEMYSSKRYELALIEVVNLEAEYPQDSRVLSMKGTLYSKLGKPSLAREAWQKALALDPQDAAVQEALRELANAEEPQ
jgi:tetratricopeptide (TPR) repeat protein